jgi:hypothetical protein
MGAGKLFLDLQLLAFELSHQRIIREGPGHFHLDLSFKSGVLGLECADVRRFHAFSSFRESPLQKPAQGLSRAGRRCFAMCRFRLFPTQGGGALSCSHNRRILQVKPRRIVRVYGFDRKPQATPDSARSDLCEGVGLTVTEEEMRKRLAALSIEHRDLDAAIDALTSAGVRDQLQIARLKKRKLLLKDQIAMIEDYLIPDIIA